MLETIREKTQGLFATILLVLIGIPFALWGINSYFEGGSAVKVATVDGVDIGVDAYRSALERQRQYMYRLLGKNADPRMFDNAAFKNRVVSSLVDEVLISQHAQDHGYRVGDQQLAHAIQNVPQFLDGSGKFDPKLYQDVLRSSGFTPAGYEKSMREDLLTSQVQAGFGQAVITETDVEQLLRLEAQQRTLAYAIVSPEQYKKTVAVTEDQIKAYYADHPDEFKVPAQVRVDYLKLSAADLAKEAGISEDELRKLYDEEAARYVTPEERRASHVLVSLAPGAKDEEAKQALAKAQDLRRQVMSGGDFAALARKHSQDPGSAAKGGDLGFVRRGAFVKEFETALFALKPGEISQPVKSQYGYHVIKLVAVKPEMRKPFAQVRGELETTLRARKAEERFYEAAQTFQNLVYEHPESLQPAAEALGLRVAQSGWFSRAGGAGIAAEPKVVDAAFTPEVLGQQRNSDAIEIGTGAVVAVRVSERQEERVRPPAEVQAQIVERLREKTAEQASVRAGEALLARVNEGNDLLAAARAAGAKYVGDKTVSRRKPEGLDPRLVQAVFKAGAPGEKSQYGGVDLGKDGYAVFALKRITEADPKRAEPALRQQVVQTLERRRGEEFFEAHLAGLRKTKPIKIYQDQL